MTKRRSLSEGIKATKAKEEKFIYGSRPKRPTKTEPKDEQPKKANAKATVIEDDEPPWYEDRQPAAPLPVESTLPRPSSRVPLTTRIRADLGASLKQASLKRQLTGEKPNTVQDILEEALEPWLKEHGYLPK